MILELETLGSITLVFLILALEIPKVLMLFGDAEERKKLKQIITSVNIPENMSVIVRTAGIGKTKKEIAKDLSFLISQWNKIRQLTIKSEAPENPY